MLLVHQKVGGALGREGRDWHMSKEMGMWHQMMRDSTDSQQVRKAPIAGQMEMVLVTGPQDRTRSQHLTGWVLKFETGIVAETGPVVLMVDNAGVRVRHSTCMYTSSTDFLLEKPNSGGKNVKTNRSCELKVFCRFKNL